MFYRNRTLGRLGRETLDPESLQAAAQEFTVPASVGGVDALNPLIAMPPESCFYTFNLMPAEYGMELRQGYREHAKNVGTTDTEVRTIVPFEGRNPGNNKLFAVTADGIYDVTAAGELAPTRVVTFLDTTSDAGYAVWTEMTIDNGEQKLFVADGRNGLHEYDEDTDTWSVPSFTGVTAANVCFVILHKQRLWVIQRGEADAYYGDIDSISGPFTKFTFGSKFKYGGELLLLANWTLDGGDGVDDYLVGVSRGGDVLTYRGSDPSQPDWTLTGSFFIGAMPDSRRVARGYAGQLYILSTYGVASLQDLVQGVNFVEGNVSPSADVNRLLREQVQGRRNLLGWQLITNPSDSFLQILQPWEFENDALQYVQNITTRAWGFWRNYPAKCADTWQGNYYLGGADGQVYLYDGDLDGTALADDPADPDIPGVAIEFSTLTAFRRMSDHARFNQANFIRAVYLAAGEPILNMQAVYDYNILAEAAGAQGVPAGPPGVWDEGIWGTDLWGSVQDGGSKLEGVAGIGRVMAIAMRGQATARMTLIGWDVNYTPAGFL